MKPKAKVARNNMKLFSKILKRLNGSPKPKLAFATFTINLTAYVNKPQNIRLTNNIPAKKIALDEYTVQREIGYIQISFQVLALFSTWFTNKATIITKKGNKKLAGPSLD